MKKTLPATGCLALNSWKEPMLPNKYSVQVDMASDKDEKWLTCLPNIRLPKTQKAINKLAMTITAKTIGVIARYMAFAKMCTRGTRSLSKCTKLTKRNNKFAAAMNLKFSNALNSL